MADINTFYAMMQSAYIDVTVFNIYWILNVVLVMATGYIISRDKGTQKYLWLPLTIAYHVAGIPPSYVWYIITTIMFTLGIFSADTIGNLIWTNLKKGGQETYQQTGSYQKRKAKGIIESMKNTLWENEVKEKTAQYNNMKDLDTNELLKAIMRGKGR